MKYIILFMFLSVFVYGNKVIDNKEGSRSTATTVQSLHRNDSPHGKKYIHKTQTYKRIDKKVYFKRIEEARTKHNSVVKPEPILPFVNVKYNSTILKGGQIFSKLKVSESRMNIKDKRSKNYAFDIHSTKNIGCVKCHTSRPTEGLKPGNYINKLNIIIDKGSIDKYLGIEYKTVENFKVKTCIDCHKDDVVKHESWLPATSNHMEKMSCETCHINKRDMFTAKSFNYALVNDESEPFITYLGKEGKSIVGFTANNIWYKGKTDKNIKIKPANMVSFLVWKDGSKFVDAKLLKKAFYNGNKLNEEMLKAFDKNNDKKLSVNEAKFDNEAKKTVAIKLLKAAGVKEAKLKLISFPVALEHNVMPEKMATKSCESCHNRKDKSILYKDAELLDYVATEDIDIIIPGTTNTKFAKIVNGKIILNKEKLPKEHFMMVTDTSNKDFDQYAILLLIATILGLLGHGMLRMAFASKRNSKE